MPTAITTDFAKTSWLWELQKLTRSGWEWIELQLNRFNVDWPDMPEWQLPSWTERVTMWLVLVVLGVGLVLFAEQAWKWGLRSQRDWRRYQANLKTTAPEPEMLRSPTEWLLQAQTYQQQGNFKEACRALYLGLLQQLQDLQLVKPQLSRTDREYVAYLRSLALLNQIPTLQPYQTLLETHERLCFSDSEISDQDFQRCYQAYQTILTDARAL